LGYRIGLCWSAKLWADEIAKVGKFESSEGVSKTRVTASSSYSRYTTFDLGEAIMKGSVMLVGDEHGVFQQFFWNWESGLEACVSTEVRFDALNKVAIFSNVTQA